MSQAVPSQSTASTFYQNTARPNVSKAVLSQSTARPYFSRPVFSTSTGRPYYPRMDNVRPRALIFLPPKGFFNTRTVDRPKSPKPIIKSKWVKKESTAGTQGKYFHRTKGENGSMGNSSRNVLGVLREFNSFNYRVKGNPEEETKRSCYYDSGLELVTSCIDFENVSYVKELKFNLLSVSQICDKKHNVFFTDTECLILSPEFKIFAKPSEDEANLVAQKIGASKGIQREYSIARTPQQNGVAERKNRTLIEAARTMLADSLLPIQFWAEAVHTACYVLTGVIGKSEEGYLLGYSTNSKGFRVYNRVTRKVQDCLHVNFLENQMNQKGKGPDWMFDLDILFFMNYFPFQFGKQAVSEAITNDAQNKDSDESTVVKEVPLTIEDQDLQKEKEKKAKEINDLSESDDDLPKDGIFSWKFSFDDEIKLLMKEIDLDINNMDNTIDVSSSSTLRIHKNHPQRQIIGHSVRSLKQENSYKMENELLELNGSSETKRDQRGTIIRNKARLVAQGPIDRKEGGDYDEVLHQLPELKPSDYFWPLHLLWDSPFIKWMSKVHFCMAISQKRAWYVRLSTFLLKHGYRRGAIDKTLFIKRDKKDIMLVQVYVDDIIFGSTKTSMVKEFEELMQKEFTMSSMGELTFFLGLQVKQSTAGIFISQDNSKLLGKLEEGEVVDVIFYRINDLVVLCSPKHQPKLGLWYPKDSPFHLEAFSDSDYAGDNHDRRSTSGGCQYLGRRLVSWQCKKQTIVAISSTEAEYVAAASCCGQDFLRDIGYEGNLQLLSFSKPLLSPQWKYLVHTLLHCLSSKSSSWDQFATNIASALDSKPFLMYPRAEHALHTEDLDIHPSSHHSDDSSAGKKAASPSSVASERPASPNDYTPTDEVQTSGGDEGHLDLHGLTREVLKLKKQNAKQAAQILRLKTKLKILVKKVKPVIAEYSSFVKLKPTLSKKKKHKKAHKQKSSSFKQGRKKVSDGSTGLNEVDVNSGDSQMMDVDDTISAEVHEDTAQVNEGSAEVHENTAKIHESTVGANLSTDPSMKKMEDEAEQKRSRNYQNIPIPGNIPEPRRGQESPTLILDPKDKGKGIMKEEPKKKKLTLQQLRAAETANDEEVARKVTAEWEEEEERKRLAGLERLQAELEDNEMIAAEVQRTERENFTEEQKAKFLVETIAAQRRFRAEQQAALERSKTPIIPQLKKTDDEVYKRISTEDETAIKEHECKDSEPSKKRKVVDFEGDSAQDVEVMEQRSLISRFSIVQSPEGEYIAVQRANGHIRAFNTLNEVLHILDRQDLHHLHRLVIEYYEQGAYTGTGEWDYDTSVGRTKDPLTRELIQKMLEHKLEVQEETEDALNVIRFVMKQKEDLEREEE
ncbi:putative ribonuclease H-like domain-containing protein [Tanacetum coccineum]